MLGVNLKFKTEITGGGGRPSGGKALSLSMEWSGCVPAHVNIIDEIKYGNGLPVSEGHRVEGGGRHLVNGSRPLLLGRRLAEHQHVHGREHAGLATRHQALGDVHEHVVHLLHAAGHQAQRVHGVDDALVNPDRAQHAAETGVPGLADDGGGGEVQAGHELKADVLAGNLSLVPSAHLLESQGRAGWGW